MCEDFEAHERKEEGERVMWHVVCVYACNLFPEEDDRKKEHPHSRTPLSLLSKVEGLVFDETVWWFELGDGLVVDTCYLEMVCDTLGGTGTRTGGQGEGDLEQGQGLVDGGGGWPLCWGHGLPACAFPPHHLHLLPTTCLPAPLPTTTCLPACPHHACHLPPPPATPATNHPLPNPTPPPTTTLHTTALPTLLPLLGTAGNNDHVVFQLRASGGVKVVVRRGQPQGMQRGQGGGRRQEEPHLPVPVCIGAGAYDSV